MTYRGSARRPEPGNRPPTRRQQPQSQFDERFPDPYTQHYTDQPVEEEEPYTLDMEDGGADTGPGPYTGEVRRARSDNERSDQLYSGYQRSKASKMPVEQRMGRTGTGPQAGVGGQGQGYPPSAYGPTAKQYGQSQGLETTRGRPTGYTKQTHDIGSGPKPKGRSRKKSQWELLKVIVVAVLLILIFNLIPFNTLISAREFLMTDMTEGMPREFPASMDYQMTRQLALGIAGGTLNYQLKVPAPDDLPDEQQISVESNLPYAISGDYMTWSGSVTNGDVTVILSYHITAYSKKWEARPEEVGGKVPSQYNIYLDDEWIITPSNERVQDLAKKITAGKTNKMDQAEALFTWMRDNIKYNTGRNWKPQTPDQTLDSKQGDCDDQSVLYASMSRYLGIPAWLEMGALYDKSINKWGGHAWLIVYLPTKDGKGIKGNVDMANHEFMFRDSYRFTEWIDDGNADHLRDFYNLWSYSTNGMGQVKDATNIYITDKVTESSDQVSERRADQGLKYWKVKSWKLPGFETMTLVSALVATVLILSTRAKMKGAGSSFVRRKTVKDCKK